MDERYFDNGQETIKNPLVIRCKNCGGELGFDILKQRYVCAHCGAITEQDSQKAEFKRWKDTRQLELSQQLSQVKAYRCPSCGAQTMTSAEEATASCPFCGNTLIDDTFSGTDLPEVIVPFKITLEEAKSRLAQWVNDHPKQAVSQTIQQHVENLNGCYLPFQAVRGSFDGKLFLTKKGGIETEHPFKAHLNTLAVNVSEEFDNMVLDGMEPFDFNEAKAFDFKYLNRQKAKITNVDAKEMNQRVQEEVTVELIRTLSTKLLNKRISLYLLGGNNESASMLLPVYFVNCGDGIVAVVNGQTGKVVIATGKETKLVKRWWLAPTMFALAMFVVGLLVSDVRFYMLAGALFLGMLFAAIGTQYKRKTVKEVLVFPKGKRSHNGTQVQFFALTGDEWQPKLKPVSTFRVFMAHLFGG